MTKIQIFVSHRTDLNSIVVDNPLYVPVRCGAIFDKENRSVLQGDDTGDNISYKKNNLSEFTVQYWAWKNIDADYYGLCHYRRYLSFSDEYFPVNNVGMVNSFCMGSNQLKLFGMLDQARMVQTISDYDIIVSEGALLTKHPSPKGKVKTVRELWEAHDGIFITKEAIHEMFCLIERMSPEYSESARAYFDSGYHRGYNCFVMKKELFCRLCEFQFPIIFAMQEWLNTRPYCDELPRLPAYIGEMLYGIFTYHIMTSEKWKVKESQLVLFYHTEIISGKLHTAVAYMRYMLEKTAKGALQVFFPLGTRRREIVKNIWHKIHKG